jgi:RNA polymerase sigma factor (sigma-70 family)
MRAAARLNATVGDERTDAELLGRTAHNGRAFELLYARHAPALFRWLERASADRQVALELTAETFAIVLERPDRFTDPGDGQARAWIFGIARNLLRMFWRSARIESAARQRLGILEETTRFSFDESRELDRMDAARQRPELHRALATLPAGQRAAIELRVVDELSYADIAARLSCSDAVARLRVSRGLARLRIQLSALRAGDEQ